MQSIPYSESQTQIRVNAFIRSVYNWMAIALALTGFTAYYVAGSPEISGLFYNVVGNRPQPSMLFWGCLIGELALVFILSARVQKMKAQTATSLFIAYSVLNGVTLSLIFFIYTQSSITSVFFICAATFVTTSLFGYFTKKDLTSMGQFMFMGLIGIIIASVANFFFKSAGMQMIISYVGVIVFVGLTAYDTQKLKGMALSQPADVSAGVIRKGALLGALTLYLDFINLFLMLLQILGDRR
jgi:uncharacterized protein